MEYDTLTHIELKRLHDEAKKVQSERKKTYSRRQLASMLTKKFKTTMIGSLASFEEHFGYLWGHGKKEEELSENEINWRNFWDEARTEILNKGNSQLRAALEEVNHYDLEWKRYHTQLVVKQDNQENPNE
jgi:hypothetical protein